MLIQYNILIPSIKLKWVEIVNYYIIKHTSTLTNKPRCQGFNGYIIVASIIWTKD